METRSPVRPSSRVGIPVAEAGLVSATTRSASVATAATPAVCCRNVRRVVRPDMIDLRECLAILASERRRRADSPYPLA